MSKTRVSFDAELAQLRLQVEVMAVRVSEALERMTCVLATGDTDVAAAALAADDDIDAMLVSLTERCYDLLRREAPVAADLRLVVSVLRLLEELERIGDLALRVVKAAPDQPRLAAEPELFTILVEMAAVARELYGQALDAWSASDLAAACGLAERSQVMETHYAALMARLLDLDGPGSVQLAVAAVLVGRALDRIADHAVIVGERLRYLLTGDVDYLASEVR